MTELREALDKMIAGYSYDAFERNGNNYPPARAAVEALFAELTRENERLKYRDSVFVDQAGSVGGGKTIAERERDGRLKAESELAAMTRERDEARAARHTWFSHYSEALKDRDDAREALAQARRAVLEEAAKVCDERERAYHNYANSYQEGRRDEADECGSAIRALMEMPNETLPNV